MDSAEQRCTMFPFQEDRKIPTASVPLCALFLIWFFCFSAWSQVCITSFLPLAYHHQHPIFWQEFAP